MKLRINGADLSTLKAREHLLGFLSRTVDAEERLLNEERFKPYRSKYGNDADWIIDRCNNWRVSFFDEAPSLIDLRYRMNGATVQAEEALATWLCYCLAATVVDAPLPTNQRIMLDESDFESLKEFYSGS